MKTNSIFLIPTLFLLSICQGHGQSLIINRHSVALFDSIPEPYKDAAADLRMLFMDRSVGFNISTYLDCLSQPWTGALSSCKRYNHMDSLYTVDPSEVYWDGTWDRRNWRYAFWPANCSEDVTCFLEYMDERLDSFDVFGCQFSYLAVTPGSKIADTLTGFFGTEGSDNKATTYAEYAALHPDKKIIWWTTSLARGIGTEESESFNTQMRDYASTNDIILFDVADILSHDPSGQPCFDNRDGVTYKDENHPDDGLNIPAICPQYTTETDGGHLGAISAGGIRVSKAFWVLMARIAGWNENITSVLPPIKTHTLLLPNPATGSVTLSFEPKPLDSSGEIYVFDFLGRKYSNLNFEIIMQTGLQSVNIPLNDLTPGMYLIQLRLGEKRELHKLVVY
jgi:Secretion system C-terminal sorting domain